MFKVMFTAIVTAMLGVTYLGWIGWLDLVARLPRADLPRCRRSSAGSCSASASSSAATAPGRRVAATATGPPGRRSSTGSASSPARSCSPSCTRCSSRCYTATPMGAITIPQYFDLPYGLVVFAVVLMAIGGFAGAGWVERWMASRPDTKAAAEGRIKS
ncbi:MAG: hypothetical protein MZV64_30750 [Ignavibacteriales bacterium]|nr:hypothetical protein [Ignavibacteriales bacterium]